MSEPAKDTAIEIAPKTERPSIRVPRIVAEINRVASRVRDRNKKEEEDNDDAEVLENDAPTPSPKPVDIKIIRENTHRRRGVDKVIVGLLVFISILLLIGCVLLGLVLKDERTKNTPSPPSPETPLSSPPSSETPLSSVSQEIVEYKEIKWETYSYYADYNYKSSKGYSFTEVMKLEGLTDDEIFTNCSYVNQPWNADIIISNEGTQTLWSYSKACVLTVLLNKLAQDNWELVSVMEYDEGFPNIESITKPIRFKRTTPITSSVATSTPIVLEHKLVFWNNSYGDFKASMVNEGITTNDIGACYLYSGTDADWEQMWADVPSINKICLVRLFTSTLEKENWTLVSSKTIYRFEENTSYHFTRPSPPPPPPPSPPPPSSWNGSCLGPSCPEVSCGSNQCKSGGYCEPTNTALCLCPPAYGGDECSSTSS
jgi:hypothetical protein